MFLGTPWSPQLCLTAFFTMRPSSRSSGRAIDFASMPISCRKTSGRKVSSNRRRSRQLSNVAAGRPKTELSINTTADHLARQTGEFYFAIRRFRAPLDNNDTAGVAALTSLADVRLPPNIRTIVLPRSAVGSDYPTTGPQGVSQMDVNGMALQHRAVPRSGRP